MTSPQQPKRPRVAISELAGRVGDGPAGNGKPEPTRAANRPGHAEGKVAPVVQRRPQAAPVGSHLATHGDDHVNNITLRDFLRSVYFYWRIGFVAMVTVLVLGILWWSNKPTYSIVDATIIKKNLWFGFGAGTQDEWDRTLQTDLSLIHSDEIGDAAGILIEAVAHLPSTTRAVVLESDGAQTETISTPANGSSDVQTHAEGFVAGDNVMVIDVQTRRVVERAAMDEPNRQTLVLPLRDARVLITSWREIEQANAAESLMALANQPGSTLAGLISVDGDPDSGEISVSSSHSHPTVASFMANVFPLAFMASSDSWIRTKNRQRKSAVEQMLSDAKRELVTRKANLQTKQSEVIDDLVGPDGAPALGISGMEFDDMRALLGGLQSQKRELADRLFIATREAEMFEQFYRQFSDPDLNKLMELEKEVQELSLHEKADGPRMRHLLRTLEGLREAYRTRGPDDFIPQMTYMSLLARRDATRSRATRDQTERELQRVTEQERELARVVQLYPNQSAALQPLEIEVDALVKKLDELTALSEATAVEAQRVPQYYQWKAPASPGNALTTSKSSWLFLIVLVALLSGLTMTRIAAIADTRVQTEAHVRGITHQPTLLNLPVLAKSNRYIYRETSGGRRTNSFIYNLFGILGVNIRHLGHDDHPEKLLCVTSAVPSEGKSFVAFNLAAYYALQGMNTCLLHCDYRHPTLEMFPDLDVDQVPGFIEYLAGNGEIDSIEECIYPTDIESLFVCLPGRITAPPIHLLDQPIFGEFLEDMQERFDVVIMDCAPLLLVVDTAIIARHARSTLLVTGMGVVKKNSLEMCIDRLNIQGINVIGTVINRDRMAAWNYYSHYYGDIVLTSVGGDYATAAADGSGTWLAADNPSGKFATATGSRANLTPTGAWPTVAGGSRPSDRFNAMLDATISSGRILIPGPDREHETRQMISQIAGIPVDPSAEQVTDVSIHNPQREPVPVGTQTTASSRREPIVPQMDTLPRAHVSGDIPVAEVPSPLPGDDSPFAGLEPGPEGSVFDSTEVDRTDPEFDTSMFRDTDTGDNPPPPPPPFEASDDFHNLD